MGLGTDSAPPSLEVCLSMKTLQNFLLLLTLCPVASFPLSVVAQTIPSGLAIDAEVGKVMTQTHAKGLTVAVIKHGKVGYVQSYGVRNAKGDPISDFSKFTAALVRGEG
jgi:CubicO group peptidase (beta-lactamase class C family)